MKKRSIAGLTKLVSYGIINPLPKWTVGAVVAHFVDISKATMARFLPRAILPDPVHFTLNFRTSLRRTRFFDRPRKVRHAEKDTTY